MTVHLSPRIERIVKGEHLPRNLQSEQFPWHLTSRGLRAAVFDLIRAWCAE